MKILIILPVLFSFFSCSPSGGDEHTLKNYDFREYSESFLSSKLREISGLAFHNGKLYSHNDENGIVYVLDLSGRIIDQFYPGVRPLRKDFEGISAAGGFIYLVTSAGTIYKFSPDSTGVSYQEFKTPLTQGYDVEGLCYDPQTNSLLLACKNYPQKKERNIRPVFAFDLSTEKLVNKPRFIIPIKELKDRFGINNFSPSGIEKHSNGNYYILSSETKAVAVFDSEGLLLEAAKLPPKHMQPEGMTFLQNNDMMISDEGGKDDAELTVYKFILSEK